MGELERRESHEYLTLNQCSRRLVKPLEAMMPKTIDSTACLRCIQTLYLRHEHRDYIEKTLTNHQVHTEGMKGAGGDSVRGDTVLDSELFNLLLSLPP